jgi:hypothetical protein
MVNSLVASTKCSTDWRGGEYTIQGIHKTDTPPGPAGRWLIERLVTLSDTETPADEIITPIKGRGRRQPKRKASARKLGR